MPTVISNTCVSPFAKRRGWAAEAPAGLSATVVSDTSIKLDWTNNDTKGDGVSIERSTDGINFTAIAVVALGVATYTDTGLTQNTKYYYRITAFKGSRHSEYSDVVNATTFIAGLLDIFLFWGKYSQISEGQMPNLVGDDYLTVTGSAGSETYTCPNESLYILGDDADCIWFNLAYTRRTVTTAELIGYDFSRTIVKYANESPYAISEIVILKKGETLTADEIDQIHEYFELSMWWSGVLNLNGVVKENRGSERSVFTIETIFDTEVMSLHSRLTTRLTGTTYTKLDTLVKGIKTDFTLTNLSDAIDQILIYGNETSEAGLLNLVSTLYNASLVGEVSFTAFEGFTGNGSDSYINTGYNPSGFPGKYKQDSGAIMMCIRNNVQKDITTPCHGSLSASNIRIGMNPYRNAGNARAYANQATDAAINPGSTSVGYTTVSRTASDATRMYRNKTGGSVVPTESSVNVMNGNLFDCAANNNGSAAYFVAHQVAIKVVSRGLSETEIGQLIDRLETYMDSNGKGVLA